MGKASPAPMLDGLPLGLLLQHLPAEMVAAAMPMVVKKLKMSPEKLALLLVRAINPDQILGELDEALLRGVTDTTLKNYKDAGELPVFINSPFPVPGKAAQR